MYNTIQQVREMAKAMHNNIPSEGKAEDVMDTQHRYPRNQTRRERKKNRGKRNMIEICRVRLKIEGKRKKKEGGGGVTKESPHYTHTHKHTNTTLRHPVSDILTSDYQNITKPLTRADNENMNTIHDPTDPTRQKKERKKSSTT